MLNLAVAGLAGGGVYALIGVCLVLAYRVGAVINFSQTFVATFAAFVMSEFVDKGWNQWLAILAGLVLTAAISAAQGVVMSKLFGDSTVLIRSTVTIGMAISFFALTILIFHDTLRNFPSLFSSVSQKIGDVTVTGSVIASLVGAFGLSLLIWLALTRTRLGIILRAVAGRPVTAELMGVRTMRMIALTWAVAGMLTYLAVLLVAPSRRNAPNIALLVIPALAAAIFGSMRSFALTIAGGLLIGMIESVMLDDAFGTVGKFRPMLSFVAITVVLLWSQRKETWGEAR